MNTFPLPTAVFISRKKRGKTRINSENRLENNTKEMEKSNNTMEKRKRNGKN